MKPSHISCFIAVLAMSFPLQALALFTSQPETKTIESNLYQYSVGVLSLDGHEVTVKLLKGPEGMRLEGEQLVWQTDFDDAGQHQVELLANDGVKQEKQSFVIDVKNKNRAPYFKSRPVQSISEGQLFEYAIDVDDADGDKFTVSYLELPEPVKRDGQTLSWQTDYQSAGIYPFKLRVSDGKVKTDQTFMLTVTDTNRAPVFAAIDEAALNATESKPWQLMVSASDADQDRVQLSLDNAPEGMTLENGQLSWKPTYQQAGQYTVTVVADDGKEQSRLPLTINVADVNRLPNFILEPETQLQETELFSFDARAFDPDGGFLQYQLLKAPKGMQIDSSHIVTWQTGYDDAGAHEVSIEVFDGSAKVQKNFVLTVANKNRAPEFVSQPVTQINEGELFNYTLKVADADGDPLKVDYLQVPKEVKQEGQQFSWQTDAKSAGRYPFHIRISDGQTSVEQSFVLVVGNVNHKPVFTSKPGKKAIEAIAYRYDFSATDADKEKLSFSLSQAPKGMQLKDESSVWVPSFEQAGTHAVVLEVSDGIDTVSQAFSIEVANTNREPTIWGIDGQTAYAGEKFKYQIKASDADDDAVSLSFTHAPRKMEISKSGEISWKPKTSDIGEHTVVIKASDGDLSTTAHFVVNVVEKPQEK